MVLPFASVPTALSADLFTGCVFGVVVFGVAGVVVVGVVVVVVGFFTSFALAASAAAFFSAFSCARAAFFAAFAESLAAEVCAKLFVAIVKKNKANNNESVFLIIK